MYMALKSLDKHSGQPTFSKYFLTTIPSREYNNPLVFKMSVAIHSDRLLFFLSIGLSVFTDFKRMPEILKENPEELWQLDEHSPFPDEVEIVVPDDRPFKGHIRPKGDLDTPFTKDNIIEVNLMFLIAYIKSPFRKELCIGMIDGSADPQFSNTLSHLQPDTFPILFIPDAEMPSLEEIHSITRG